MSKQETTPYIDLFRAMQELGAALDAFGGDLPDVLRALAAAHEEASDFVEASAIEEQEHAG